MRPRLVMIANAGAASLARYRPDVRARKLTLRFEVPSQACAPKTARDAELLRIVAPRGGHFIEIQRRCDLAGVELVVEGLPRVPPDGSPRQEGD